MGEAKRRKLHPAASAPALTDAVSQVSAALRKLAGAASSLLGADCYIHAELGRLLLADLGVESRLVLGYAAWRIGPGDGDVVAHTPRTKGYLPAGAEGLVYHAWLETAEHLIDFTTYQFERKARYLDDADGGHTKIEWTPDFLLIRQREVNSYQFVASASGPGCAYYERDPNLNAILKPQLVLDPDDLRAARLLLANPQMVVVGPNDIADVEAETQKIGRRRLI